MAQFPKSEAQIIVLAQQVIAGFKAQTALFPAPPVALTALETALQTYLMARTAAVAAQATAEQSTAAKDEALQTLVDDLKADLRYAENTVDYDDAQLKQLGWGGRTARTSLQRPGQPRVLEAPRRGEGWLFLDWKEPVEGGKVVAYKVQRCLRTNADWQDIATALDSEITLMDQPRAQELEYRILSLNKAGDSEPSNTLTVIL